MVTSAQGQPVTVGECREIVGMRGLHHETDQRATLCAWSKHPHSRQLFEPFHGIMSELHVVLENRGASDLLDVINGRFQPDGSCNIRCARLKSVGRFLEQIGRASCRERVESPVVGVWMKRKHGGRLCARDLRAAYMS